MSKLSRSNFYFSVLGDNAFSVCQQIEAEKWDYEDGGRAYKIGIQYERNFLSAVTEFCHSRTTQEMLS